MSWKVIFCSLFLYWLYQVRELSEDRLPRVFEMEKTSYPGDEPATPEKLRFRQKFARPFFLEASLVCMRCN